MPRSKKPLETVTPEAEAAMPETAAAMPETVETASRRAPQKTITKGQPVSPAELIELARKLQGQPGDVIAMEAGYYTETTITATGETSRKVTSADLDAFMCGLVAAQGISIAPPSRAGRRDGRKPIIKIGKTGNIVVGGRHTSAAGFLFGEDVDSKVEVKVKPGEITITAAPLDAYEDEDSSFGSDDSYDVGEESEIDG